MLDVLAWANRFIRTASVSRDGNAEIAQAARELMAEVGIEARLIPFDLNGVKHWSVIGDLGPAPDPDASAREGGLLLVTHLDTVPADDPAAWTATGGDPWNPTRDGDKLYGLGSADAKVDLVCKLAALSQIDPSRLVRPLRVVGTFAEEIGMWGARELVRSGGTRGFASALVSEPSELVAMIAHKGYAVYRASIPLARIPGARGTAQQQDFQGAAAHSSTPHLGRNAIEAALTRLADADVHGVVTISGGSAVNVIPDRCSATLIEASGGGTTAPCFDPQPLIDFHAVWRGALEQLAAIVDSDFDPNHSVGNLGRISLEDDRAVVSFDLRPVPGVDLNDAVAALAKVAQVELIRENPPLATPRDSALVTAVMRAQQSAGMEARIATKATCTEAGILSEAGLDVIVMGPGPSVGNVHKPNEHTRISDLERAPEIYRHAIEQLCIEVEPCSS